MGEIGRLECVTNVLETLLRIKLKLKETLGEYGICVSSQRFSLSIFGAELLTRSG